MRLKQALFNHIYALYNRDDEILFVGTSKECIDYIGCTRNAFYVAISSGQYCARQYKVFYVGLEPVEYKKCTKCGKVKPIKDFYIIRKKSGKKIVESWCKTCMNSYKK